MLLEVPCQRCYVTQIFQKVNFYNSYPCPEEVATVAASQTDDRRQLADKQEGNVLKTFDANGPNEYL